MFDFKKVYKFIKKNNLIPKNIFNFSKHNFNEYTYHIVCSERSLGKTTTALIIGMVLREFYGTTTIYMRQTVDMIRPKNTVQLFNVILENKYVEIITNGKWNGIHQYSRFFYYCNYDENGKRIETDNDPFCVCVALSEQYEIKSTFNVPNGDWIIFDEFISKYYAQDEFVVFMDVLKTIIRDRTNPIILLLSNTIDNESQYFYDFEIYDMIKNMEFGEICDIATDGGTAIQVEFPISVVDKNSMKYKSNKKYFSFSNTKLRSITGGGWAVSNYQHPFGDFEITFNRLYLKYHDKYIKCDYVYHNDLNRTMLYFHKATKTYDDSIIITNMTPRDVNEYNVNCEIFRNILELINKKYVMYQNNTIGNIVDKFIKG